MELTSRVLFSSRTFTPNFSRPPFFEPKRVGAAKSKPPVIFFSAPPSFWIAFWIKLNELRFWFCGLACMLEGSMEVVVTLGAKVAPVCRNVDSRRYGVSSTAREYPAFQESSQECGRVWLPP